MKVHIDLMHPAHVNLFKGIINRNPENLEFVVTCLNRGRVAAIAQKEIHGVKIHVIGKHKGTFLSILFEANLLRLLRLYVFLRKEKIDVGLSFGSFIASTVLKVKGVKSIQLDDDPERMLNVLISRIVADEIYFPPIVQPKGKTGCFNALKEWSYLSPRYFRGDITQPSIYGLNPKEYIFVREVSTGSLNYQGQASNPIAGVAASFPAGMKVLLSLEDKSTLEQYPKDWILLKEPVNDIHSLIYYSRAVVSSGDSMAREGAMLGVPGIYCGFREMKANDFLRDKGILAKVAPDEVPVFLQKVVDGKELSFDQDGMREQLLQEWDDVNDFMLEKLHKLVRKQK